MSTELSDAEKEAIRVMDLRAKMTDPTPTERLYTEAEVADLRAELERTKKTLAHVYELAMTEDGLADFDADSIRDAWLGYVSREELDEVRTEMERLKQALADDADEDTAIRRKAAAVLGNWVFGDSHGVPSLTSVVGWLVERVRVDSGATGNGVETAKE